MTKNVSYIGLFPQKRRVVYFCSFCKRDVQDKGLCAQIFFCFFGTFCVDIIFVIWLFFYDCSVYTRDVHCRCIV